MNTSKAMARLSRGGNTQRRHGACVGYSMALLTAAALALFLSINPVRGGDTFQDKCVPPVDGIYTPEELARYHAAFPDGSIYTDPVHGEFARCFGPPPAGGGTSNETFGSTVYMARSQGGVTTSVNATGDVAVAISMAGTSADGTESYTTEMTGLAIGGGSMPALTMIRESPGLMSTGMTTIKPIRGGGGYAIDSFFDIYLEVSMDGGVSYAPMFNPIRMKLFKRPHVVAPPDSGPPGGCVYVSPGEEEYGFLDSLVKIRKIQHDQLPQFPLPIFGMAHTNIAPASRVRFEYSSDGGSSWHSAAASAGMLVAVNHAGSSPPFELYETEMLGLGFSAGNIQIRESPTKASTGRYHTEVIGGGGGGGGKAASFFDVFLEVSTDGGNSWSASTGPVRVELTVPQVSTIPTMSEWGLIILMVLLLGLGALVIRRQQAAGSRPAAA